MKNFCTLRLIICFFSLFGFFIICLVSAKLYNYFCESKLFTNGSSHEKLSTDLNMPPFNGEKVVHLDLKGAPPSVDYFRNIFPLFRDLGVTSLLVEYEDTFPFSNKFLPAINAFSKKDISILLNAAKKNSLKVIPLVQTFGHLEFLLKMKNFSHFRELDRDPQCICPSRNDTMSIISNLLDEVIEAHPNIRYIHIGSDEVYKLGVCQKCVEKMSVNRWSTDELFLDHVVRVAKFIRSKYPRIIPLMWDDQLRSISHHKLRNFDIGTLVEPVVWSYKPVISFPPEMWRKYAEIFPAVWVASSFKGATSINQLSPNISFHIQNHVSWMHLMFEYGNLINFRGVVITGWQRYDHFSVMCELLPVGIPSLVQGALILQGVNSARRKELQSIQNVLKCGINGEFTDSCKFPGVDVYHSVMNFSRLKIRIDNILSSDYVNGYFTDYNLKTKYFSRMMEEELSLEINNYRNLLKQTESDLRNSLSTVYDKYTISEWIETNLDSYASKLSSSANALNSLKNISNWGPRYKEFTRTVES